MTIDNLPICDAGRCSVILDALAARDDRISGNLAAVVAAAIEATLTDFGVDHADTTVRAALAGHLARLGGTATDPGKVT
ncbi:hypothetical protein ACQEVZ_24790 [Dactylosporangium sp. CA-152071]|uniref:hypothetical protein n=1 Tax=Dactylosporangium sp. CA-152071 TaxID=3239933 RepID=UPI003D8DC942